MSDFQKLIAKTEPLKGIAPRGSSRRLAHVL
jgi:hypothetical protein